MQKAPQCPSATPSIISRPQQQYYIDSSPREPRFVLVLAGLGEPWSARMPTCFIMAPKTPVWFGSSPSCEKELPRRARVFTWKRSHEISIESPRSCIKLQTLTLDRYPQTKDGSKTHHVSKLNIFERFFRTCQVRVFRFYVSCLLLSSSPLLLLLLNRDPRRTLSCRTSTTTIPAQCSGPQP